MIECFCRIYSSKANRSSTIISCDSTDADMGSLGFVLLHLTGVQSMTKKIESEIHTVSGQD